MLALQMEPQDLLYYVEAEGADRKAGHKAADGVKRGEGAGSEKEEREKWEDYPHQKPETDHEDVGAFERGEISSEKHRRPSWNSPICRCRLAPYHASGGRVNNAVLPGLYIRSWRLLDCAVCHLA